MCILSFLSANWCRALLTFPEALQLLTQFCAKLPRKDVIEQTNPSFLTEGEHGLSVRAEVRLPSSLPPRLQSARSRLSWQTERKAKQDAAFQAYRALYEAGLVTDHFLPLELPKENKAPKEGDEVETRDSFYAVAEQYDPWSKVVQLWTAPGGVKIYAHRVKVEERGVAHPSMLILLPVRLSESRFTLYRTESARLSVAIEAGVEIHDCSVDTAQQVTVLLLTTILGRRLQGLQKENIPFLLVPDVGQASLQAWYEAAVINTPLTGFAREGCSNGHRYLIQPAGSIVPYLWQPAPGDYETQENRRHDYPEVISGIRISRKLDYTVPNAEDAQAWKQVEQIPTVGCSVLGVPGEYAHFMTLVPSIMYMLEVSLRSNAACEGPLSSLRLDGHDMVSQALTLPDVSSRNYQRLEFLGDALLKFYATLHVFCTQPDHPSYQLTRNRAQIINNARLQRSTRSLGLDQYLTRNKFSGKGWAVGAGILRSSTRRIGSRELSSKTLADIAEAVIGAVSASVKDADKSEVNVLAALRLFIDEIPWMSISENIALMQVPERSSGSAFDMLVPVEAMIGYEFQNRALLVEALTQSSLAGCQRATYDRLEFLGDAVLDFIIGPRLFHSRHQLGPHEMTGHRHALASHQTLAFFAQNASVRRSTFEIYTDPQSKKTVSHEKSEETYLPDYIQCVDRQQMLEQRRVTFSAFRKARPLINKGLVVDKCFPWTQLSRLGALKSYSDIMESILAAVFVDSKGNIGACEKFLDAIGYMSLVRRFVNDGEMTSVHPESVLDEAISRKNRDAVRKLRYITQEREKPDSSGKHWRCKVVYDGNELARVKHSSSSTEARCRAAEKALKFFKMSEEKEEVIENGRKTRRKRKPEGDSESDTQK